MTNLKFKIVLVALIAFVLTLTSCGNKSDNSSKTEQSQQGKEYTSAYICTMHCKGSGSDHAGKCPVCEMDYVKNETHTHACPMHNEITGKKGDECSKCGMDLTPMKGDEHKGHNH